MNDKQPCNCQEAQAFGAAGGPSLGELRAALELARSAGPAAHLESLAAPAPVADPQTAPSPSAQGVVSVAADLQALLAIARANPGLKITLSF